MLQQTCHSHSNAFSKRCKRASACCLCRVFNVKNLKWAQSPVFLSTGADGRVQRGCGGIPLDRPLLLVSNHQTFALDIGILIDGLLRQTGVLPRGLTHPAVFQVRPAVPGIKLPLQAAEGSALTRSTMQFLWRASMQAYCPAIQASC